MTFKDWMYFASILMLALASLWHTQVTHKQDWNVFWGVNDQIWDELGDSKDRIDSLERWTMSNAIKTERVFMGYDRRLDSLEQWQSDAVETHIEKCSICGREEIFKDHFGMIFICGYNGCGGEFEPVKGKQP